MFLRIYLIYIVMLQWNEVKIRKLHIRKLHILYTFSIEYLKGYVQLAFCCSKIEQNPEAASSGEHWPQRYGRTSTIGSYTNKYIHAYIHTYIHTCSWFLASKAEWILRFLKGLVDAFGAEGNKTLTLLNVESNFLTGSTLVALTKATVEGKAIEQLHLANQVRFRTSLRIRRVRC